MRVIKRDNTYEDISFDKVLRRLRTLWGITPGLSDVVSPDQIAQKVCARIYDGVHTSELDELSAQLCATMVTTHPDYGVLAARIAISNHHKNTSPSFSEVITTLYESKDVHGRRNSLVSQELWDIVQVNKEKLNSTIDYDRDYTFDYFGFKTLERSYLLKDAGKTIERPQHMWMRVALGIHGYDIKEAIETYEHMSKRFFTHATPTLFNAGTPQAQLSSCYLLHIPDSVTGMYKTVSDCAQISKYAGGIGVHAQDIRARGSQIRGTNGISSGIIPMLRVYNATARHVNQAGKRAGSIAVYLEPWHADIESFLDIRKNHGAEEERCRDLFTAMWIPDLFMRRVQENGDWSLMCPDECQGLTSTYGAEFDSLYEYYEAAGTFRKKVKAQAIWLAIIKSQVETGTPYLCYKDPINVKSNQKNIGVIKSSNLCVAPETLILTEQGNKVIKDIVDQEVNVWNGHEFSNVTVRQTGSMQPLLTVSFNNGFSVRCTPYHKFYIQIAEDNMQIIEAKDLNVGMIITPYILPDDIETLQYVLVSKVEDCGDADDTYCFNEPVRHAGIFNGVLMGNCSEITEYSDENEVASCNLASIALPSFIIQAASPSTSATFDYKRLHAVAQIVSRNINKVIDRTFYPIPEARYSNLKHRPMGIGVQGLADVYALLRIPFDSPEAAACNKRIFETIYHGALTASNLIAKKRAALREEYETSSISNERKAEITTYLNMTPEEQELTTYKGAYVTFDGSPVSQGQLQYDLWKTSPSPTSESGLDWDSLKAEIAMYGIRNSLLIAVMPTASTSQILGFNECIEPFTSNIYQRQTMAGEFTVINKYLLSDLLRLGMWSVEMKDRILLGDGSIQHIQEIPEEIRSLYKTVWEIKQKVLIDQAADRGPFVCQSQSLNLYAADTDMARLSNMHFYSWKVGNKTGVYYLRTRPKARMTAFTLDPKTYAASSTSAPPSPSKEEQAEAEAEAEEEPKACRLNDPSCLMCGS